MITCLEANVPSQLRRLSGINYKKPVSDAGFIKTTLMKRFYKNMKLRRQENVPSFYIIRSGDIDICDATRIQQYKHHLH